MLSTDLIKKVESEDLATELCESSEYELEDLKTYRSKYRQNTFRSVFARLREAVGSVDPRSEASEQDILYFLEEIISYVEAASDLLVLYPLFVCRNEKTNKTKEYNFGPEISLRHKLQRYPWWRCAGCAEV